MDVHRAVDDAAGTTYLRVTMGTMVLAAGLGITCVAAGASANMFTWEVSTCSGEGVQVGDCNADEGCTEAGITYQFDMKVDIGWEEFTVDYIDDFASGCFDLNQGSSYAVEDHEANDAFGAAIGMVSLFVLSVAAALYTVYVLHHMRAGRPVIGSLGLKGLAIVQAILALGTGVATIAFWWLVDGKFGDRDQALSARLMDIVRDAALVCSSSSSVPPCLDSKGSFDGPEWALALGIAQVCVFALASFLLWLRAERIEGALDGTLEPAQKPMKHVVGVEFVVEGEEKQRRLSRNKAGGRTAMKVGAARAGEAKEGNAAGPIAEGARWEDEDEEHGRQDENMRRSLSMGSGMSEASAPSAISGVSEGSMLEVSMSSEEGERREEDLMAADADDEDEEEGYQSTDSREDEDEDGRGTPQDPYLSNQSAQDTYLSNRSDDTAAESVKSITEAPKA